MITSLQNNQVINWKKLQQRKYRTKTNTFLIEGYHLIEEVRKSDWEIATLLFREDIGIPEWAESHDIEILSKQVFKEISETETPQGIAAVVNMQPPSMHKTGTMLLVDAVQDPGNLGTIIRTAEALGFKQIILGKGTVDLYNEKVIRASQGAIFNITIIQDDLADYIMMLKVDGYMLYASALTEDAISLNEVKFTEHSALIVGNEGSGISEQIMQKADYKVIVPIDGKADSLNVSIAAGIMMYCMRNN